MTLRVWVVLPALNEAEAVEASVAAAIADAAGCVVVDGGSRDATREIAARAGAIVHSSDSGRGVQMNAGARLALSIDPSCDALLFVHADCRLPPDWARQVRSAGGGWARFDVMLVPERVTGWRKRLLGVIGWFMNRRSALTGICTGDQGLLVPTHAFEKLDGFAVIPLMEDIEFSRRLKRLLGEPICLPGPMRVSARRWETRGVLATMLAMLSYRLRYFLGASPASLHQRYYGRVAGRSDVKSDGG